MTLWVVLLQLVWLLDPVSKPDPDFVAPVLEALPQHLQYRLDELRTSPPKEGDRQAWTETEKVWPPGYAIKVSFIGGNVALRKTIADTASEWTRYGNVKFDFGDATAGYRSYRAGDQSDVRVSFSYRGYWSLVGTDARTIAQPNEATLNLDRFDTEPPPEPEFSGTIRHEFGHALGLMHEHQHPDRACDFDFDKLYIYLAKSPNNWSKEKVDHNLKQATYFDKSRLKTPVLVDPESVMHYSFPDWMFKTGKKSPCCVPYRSQLSEGDKKSIDKLYPSDDEAQRTSDKRTDMLLKALNTPGQSESAKKSLEQKVQMYNNTKARKPQEPK